MATAKQAKIAVAGFTLFMTLVVLGIVIATLVKVYQKPKNTAEEADGLSNKANIVNVPPAVTISSQNSAKYDAFKAYVKTLQDSLNTKVSPCDDFFTYTCGNYKPDMSFTVVEDNNMRQIAKHAKKDQTTRIAQQAAYHFKKCFDAHKDPSLLHRNGTTVSDLYNDYKTKSGIPFPLFDSAWKGDFPDPATFARAIGVLTGTFNIDTFVSLQVDTNWEHPSDADYNSYAIFVDQTKLALPYDTFYTKAWYLVKDGYRNTTADLFKAVANFTSTKLDAASFDSDVDDILNLELYIAQNINTPEAPRRNYKRQVNQKTVQQGTTAFPMIDFQTYLKSAMVYASTAANEVVKKENYTINFNEPDQLQRLSDYLQSNKVKPRTIYNYLFFRLFYGNRGFFPQKAETLADDYLRKDNKILGRRGKDRRRQVPMPHHTDIASDDEIDIACARQNAEYLWYINARFFVEELLPTEQKRKELKEHVASLMASTLDGFQTQIDQLDWMQDDTKKGAYDKIKYLVRNVAYPEQILDDDWLTAFYAKLDFGLNDDYLKVLDKMKQFLVYNSFELLTITDGTVRDDFGGPPSIVNAWYQPEMNSITFPLGILQQPFYDINYPASVNFGAMGVIAGHELTHGFDDEGVQWDGFGRLSNWIDPTSKVAFDQMANCVVNQYDQFSPVENFTVDGRQTLGENMADNGGIRGAYNAFQAHQAFFGPDARLPDKWLDAFTHEQLFFLGFARVWCEINPGDARLQTQVLIDPHSPSQFRVLGTIQNFPAFRSAFNCPEGSTYAPTENNRCTVWASEVKVVTGIPPAAAGESGGKVNNINPPQEDKSGRFRAVAERLNAAVNLSAAPCNDFYQYACGGYKQSDLLPIETAHASVRKAALAGINKTASASDPLYLSLGKAYFNSCKNYDLANPRYSTLMIETAESLLDQPFPAVKDVSQLSQLDPVRMGSLIGSMWALYNTDLFVGFNVKSVHKHFPVESGYALYVDQPHLTFDQAWYNGTKADETRKLLTILVSNAFDRYATAANLNYKQTQFDQDVKDVVDYEFHLATDLMENEYKRTVQYERVRVNDLIAATNFVNITVLFSRIVTVTKVPEFIGADLATHDVILEAPAYLQKIDRELSGSTIADQRLRAIYNYIYWRLLQTNELFLPGDFPKPFNKPPKVPLTREEECTEALNWQMAPVYSRVAVDEIYQSHENFIEAQLAIAEIADDVQHGFSTMIDSLPWLSLSARKVAHAKVDGIVRNIGIPQDILFDQTLNTEYYSGFQFTNDADFVSNVLDLKAHSKREELKRLILREIKRDQFIFNQYSDPIWSAYDLNSITFTLDLMQAPVYSPSYPSALNFGLLGSLIGHEIGHAFDKNGITYDQFGQLRQWFDPRSYGYKEMLTCLKTQYGKYCPGSSECVMDSEATLNDNLADNIGLQAAIRGFRIWNTLKGKDARLSGDAFSRFTNEQLFFLGYAQQYCPATDYEWYNFGAKQSPNKYRLLGALSNSHIFRDTFNCPAGQIYSPQDMCLIWESPIDNPSLGVPRMETQAPPLNIPNNLPQFSLPYQECSDTIENSIDTTVDPCDDFFGYVCRRYQGSSAFADITNNNQIQLVKRLRKQLPNEAPAVAYEKDWFRKCTQALDNWDSVTAGALMPLKKITQLERKFGFKFPLATPNPTNPNPQVDATLISKMIGFINRNFEGVYPLLAGIVDSDYLYPERGYKIYFDAPVLLQETEDIQGSNWNNSKQQIAQDYAGLLKVYLDAVGATATQEQIETEALNMATFEYYLAQNVGDDPDGNNVTTIYHPYTIANATNTFVKSINISEYLLELSNGIDKMADKVNDPNYVIMIQSEDNYDAFTKNLQDVFSSGRVTSDTILNYFCFRIIVSTQFYLPGNPAPPWFALHHKPRRTKGLPEPGFKRPPSEIPGPDHPVLVAANVSPSEYLCSRALGLKFTEINNRLFVEAVFPDERKRNDTRLAVARFAEAIAVSFRGMIDQLTWMSQNSKVGAYDKLDLFVRNILYANHTFEGTFVDEYYETLLWDLSASFVDLQIIMGRFLIGKDVGQLAQDGPVSRTDFADTAEVNAYYQPTANSITILAGITQPPFYHPEWPAAINFGAIGLVLGHEITHGFDNNGVLWDGIGAYKQWMDEDSKASFDDMAQCVIKEYDQYCMNNSVRQICTDGSHTQGENIADNGGIQSAFRAYRSYVGYYGEDRSLPGRIAGQFTNDQLFFIGFARTWCSNYYAPIESYNWANEHSPGPFRIRGALSNFDAFRAAFNCPPGKTYSPTDPSLHCKVWVTDVNPKLAVPTRPALLPNINLPEPEKANGNDTAYDNVVDYFKASIDIKQNPCDNFFEYTCNKIQTPTASNAQKINMKVAQKVSGAIEALTDAVYTPIKQYYEQCQATLSEPNINNRPDNKTVPLFIQDFSTDTGLNFPLFDAPGSSFPHLTATEMGKALGYLSGSQAINTFLNVRVLKKFEVATPSESKYVVNIGEPLLTQPVQFYQKETGDAMKFAIKAAFEEVLKAYRIASNKTTTLDKNIAKAVEVIYKIEYLLASQMRSDEDRNTASKSEVFVTYNTLNSTTPYAAVDWLAFFNRFGANAPAAVRTNFTLDAYQFTVPEAVPGKNLIENIFKTIGQGNTNQINGEDVLNYLNFRVIWDLATSLLPINNDGSGDLSPIDDKQLLIKYVCALETRELDVMHSQVYANSIRDETGDIEKLREAVAKVGNQVIGALKAQVQNTNWLPVDIKKKAGAKFDALTLNTLIDNKTLDANFNGYYDSYPPVSSPTPDPHNVLEAFRKFKMQKQLELLGDTPNPVVRSTFIGSSSGPAPVYDPVTNSLSIPLSLGIEPYFSKDYPLASNYGGLGYLIAHELSHSFDKFGIQFNGTGYLEGLFGSDVDAQDAFNGVAGCLVSQYSNFCPLANGGYQPNCLDGTRTLNENIADNAGIHAAYSAYLAAANFAGNDPRLNDDLMGQFTENQLFFLSYVRDLCVPPQDPDQIYAGIISGVNPANIRVQAALQNYPAFKSAFNCPAKSQYVKQGDICNVWVTEGSKSGNQ